MTLLHINTDPYQPPNLYKPSSIARMANYLDVTMGTVYLLQGKSFVRYGTLTYMQDLYNLFRSELEALGVNTEKYMKHRITKTNRQYRLKIWTEAIPLIVRVQQLTPPRSGEPIIYTLGEGYYTTLNLEAIRGRLNRPLEVYLCSTIPASKSEAIKKVAGRVMYPSKISKGGTHYE